MNVHPDGHAPFTAEKTVVQRNIDSLQELVAFAAPLGVKVMVEKVLQLDSMYGTSHLHIMSDADGNVFVWFSSAGACETGKEIVLQGTIKKHDERNGVKQNVLTRCSEVELKNYFTFVAGEIHKFEAASEDEVKKLLRAKLNIKKLPAGTRILQDVPQVVTEERVAV